MTLTFLKQNLVDHLRWVRPALGAIVYSAEQQWARMTGNTNWLLRRRFNRWARWDVGPQMERDHRGITEKAVARMSLSTSDRILDLGCGTGWASRLVLERAGQGARVIGIDLADEMVRRAREESGNCADLFFLQASAERMPLLGDYFTKILSVEVFYFIERQEAALQELFRVTAAHGQLFLLLGLHKENPDSRRWMPDLKMPVHMRSAAEYKAMVERAGWREVETKIFEPTEGPKGRDETHERALLIVARKPAPALSSTGRFAVN